MLRASQGIAILHEVHYTNFMSLSRVAHIVIVLNEEIKTLYLVLSSHTPFAASMKNRGKSSLSPTMATLHSRGTPVICQIEEMVSEFENNVKGVVKRI